MELTGFADEAGASLADQIRATQALGWRWIEARSVDGVNLVDLPEAAFDRAGGQLAAAGIGVNCFGSAIANWGKSITDPFAITLEETRRAIARMHRLGARLIRIMSYAILPGRAPDDQFAEERFARLRTIHQMFTAEGLTPVHENCMNYGGMGWPFTLRLLEAVPGLKLVFDTGNPVFAPDYRHGEPRPRQSSWEFYEHVREHIAYVHIKDGLWSEAEQKVTYTWPGEGQGDVRRILGDLFARGYDGALSIEPHMQWVFHEAGASTGREPATDAGQRIAGYVEYGRRLERLIAEVRGGGA
jgi:sugar phosphate isomerase/epimerase